MKNQAACIEADDGDGSLCKRSNALWEAADCAHVPFIGARDFADSADGCVATSPSTSKSNCNEFAERIKFCFYAAMPPFAPLRALRPTVTTCPTQKSQAQKGMPLQVQNNKLPLIYSLPSNSSKFAERSKSTKDMNIPANTAIKFTCCAEKSGPAIAATKIATAALAENSPYAFLCDVLKRNFTDSPVIQIKNMQFSCQLFGRGFVRGFIRKVGNFAARLSKIPTICSDFGTTLTQRAMRTPTPPFARAITCGALAAAFILIASVSTPAHAERAEGGGYVLQYVISGGGATNLVGGDYRLMDVKFQPVIGVASGGVGVDARTASLGWIYTVMGVPISDLITALVDSLRIVRVADTPDSAVRISWTAPVGSVLNVYRQAGDFSNGLGWERGWRPAVPAAGFVTDDNQVGAGDEQVYYRVAPPPPPVGLPDHFSEYPAVGKVNNEIRSRYNAIGIPFEYPPLGNSLDLVVGNQLQGNADDNSADLIYKHSAGTDNYDIAFLGGTGQWVNYFQRAESPFQIEPPAGYFIYRRADLAKIITLVGRVPSELNSDFVQNYNLFGLGIPRTLGFDPNPFADATLNDRIYDHLAGTDNYDIAIWDGSSWKNELQIVNPANFSLRPIEGYFYRRLGANFGWRRILP